MSAADEAIAIVGAGECGVAAAFALRDLGHHAGISLIGDEPHIPYERPPLSKTVPASLKPIRDSSDYDAADITLLRGHAVAGIDPEAQCLRFFDGGTLQFEKLLLATGARPRVFPGLEQARTFRTLDDADAILSALSAQTRLVVIGGGFIGLELAACARLLGASVTVLEAGARTMARAVPPSISDYVATRHKQEGVDIRYGAHVSDICGGEVRCLDGRTFAHDVVVAGTGSWPNVELAADAGLAIDNGIVVDQKFLTSSPGIYAAGDCCSFPYNGRHIRLESWRAAREQGRSVAASMLGHDIAHEDIPWLWSDQYDLGLQVVGLPAGTEISARRPVADAHGFIDIQCDGRGRIVFAAGVGKGNKIAKDMRLLEMMIRKQARPTRAALADPSTNLKALLKAA
ncbi:NAD(P)/FAD-dependent oxidoreductase [Hoeflea prorocentri]|uniref:FAD-dependent oxidoreductase n=1 Tax=Hoeflea prorocentri TaxID=1922333 RepID=A0A9X3UDW6_9HYPH|nr:FAD-dependent oxidoreductase [Hoeflea prorocentri]MCY6379623.1 FAD-dependent oxidoreductase [Hoeflea prorocentri]MDA5397423.1 FAD-dependent oxidoreductase [Hoeflea prorocentri]